MSWAISGTGWLQDGVEPMLAWGHGTPARRSLLAHGDPLRGREMAEGGDTTPQAPWGTKPEVGPSPLGATGVGPEVGPSPVGAMGSRTGGGSITRGCHRRGIGGGDDSGSPRCARKHSPQMFKEAIQLWQSPPRPASVC